MISSSIFQLSIELVGAFFTFFCACSMMLEKKIFPRRSLLLAMVLFANTALLVSDALALGFRGNSSVLGYYMVRINNYVVFLLTPLIILLVFYFLLDIIESAEIKVRPFYTKLLVSISGIHILILIISQFTDWIYYFDEANTYHRTAWFPLMTIFALAELFVLACVIVAYRHHISTFIRRVLIFYIFVPIISAVIQTFYYGISLNNIAATIALILLFLTYEVSKSSLYYNQKELLIEREMALKTQELILSNQQKELAEARMQISLSQMQPHFMFNTLGSIEQLCKIDATRATAATHNFAQYLRNNLQAMNATTLKLFSDEIKHVHNYIWLEQMRFGEDLEYTEEIDVSDFLLPILSIQPIIENSVYEGMQMEEDGVIRIHLKAYEDDDYYHIEIRDNLSDTHSDSCEEVLSEPPVFSNISEHLKILCNGTITMKRLPEEGTLFHLMIPQDKAK